MRAVPDDDAAPGVGIAAVSRTLRNSAGVRRPPACRAATTLPRRVQPRDVRRHGARPTGGQAPVDEVPREVPLDDAQPEEVPDPGQHLAGSRVVDALEAGGELVPLHELGVGTSGLYECMLVGVEQRRRILAGRLGRRAKRGRDLRDHRLHAVREQLALGLGHPQRTGRPAHVAAVGQRLDRAQQRGAVQGRVRRPVRHVPRDPAGIDVLELTRVVGQQPFGHELQEHRVVPLERHEHVEVRTQRDEPVLGQEPRPAARLARGLQRLQGVPGRHRLEGGGQGLEVLAVLVGVRGAGEHVIEGLEQLLVREMRRVRLRDQGQQPALVLGVVEQNDLLGFRAARELPALVAIGDSDDERELAHVDGRTVERDPTLHERAEHREESASWARDR